MRKHHKISAHHQQRLALAFAMEPGLSASDQVKNGALRAGGVEWLAKATSTMLAEL
jgi:hypothetical protein